MRTLLRALCIAAACTLLASTPLPLHLSIQIKRASLDLLDDTSFVIVVDNAGTRPLALRFASPNEYTLELLRDGKTVWHSIPAFNGIATIPGHQKTLFPGAHPLVTYDWNGILGNGLAPHAGTYALRATLLTEHNQQSVTVPLHLSLPLPISALQHIHDGVPVTVSGVLSPNSQMLSDPTGNVLLFRKIFSGVLPGEVVIARGYMQRPRGGTASFLVSRFAPLARVAPKPNASPTPAVIPCGPRATPCRTFHQPVPTAAPTPHR